VQALPTVTHRGGMPGRKFEGFTGSKNYSAAVTLSLPLVTLSLSKDEGWLPYEFTKMGGEWAKKLG
jgi:hypothetical protein